MTRLDSLDGLVFTGGIGENAPSIRTRICRRLRAAGVPPVRIRDVATDTVLRRPDQAPAVLRVAAREDVVIARAVERLPRSRRRGT
jgi:acetate kinase